MISAAVRSPVTAALGAAVLFGIVNVLWRFGEGSVAVLAATRAAAGLVLFSPLVWHAHRTGRLAAIAQDRAAWLPVALSGASVWTAAYLFREVPGPLAAATIGVAPVVALVVGRAAGSKRIGRRAAVAVLVCGAAAVFTSGATTIAAAMLAPVGLFLAVDVASVVATEGARRRHSAAALTSAGLLIAAVPAPVLWIVMPPAPGGFAVAVAVAGLGTLGRLLRSHSLGYLNAAVVSSGTQVTALVTALGGAIVFADDLGIARLLSLLLCCAAAVAALVWSTDRRGDREKL